MPLHGELSLGLSSAVALSAVAALGYLFGRSQRRQPLGEGRGEIGRAMRIALQLEQIADGLRHELALHRSTIDRFKGELRRAEGDPSSAAWDRLREQADDMVAPTLRLVSHLSSAYDKIRLHSQALTHFTGGRTDPLTGLANSRSLEEQLAALLRSASNGGGGSSVVVVSIDRAPGHDPAVDGEAPEHRVREVSKVIADVLRGEDFAARYGVDDFVAVLPGTTLAGAGVFGHRLRDTLQQRLGVTISCGLAESMPADTPRSLLSRADSAAYSAKATGPGRQCVHTGLAIRGDGRAGPPPPGQPGGGSQPPVALGLPDPAAVGLPLSHA